MRVTITDKVIHDCGLCGQTTDVFIVEVRSGLQNGTDISHRVVCEDCMPEYLASLSGSLFWEANFSPRKPLAGPRGNKTIWDEVDEEAAAVEPRLRRRR